MLKRYVAILNGVARRDQVHRHRYMTKRFDHSIEQDLDGLQRSLLEI